VANNHDVGVNVYASDAVIETTVVRDTQPRQENDRLGLGVRAVLFEGLDASVSLSSSVLSRNHTIGMSVEGSRGEVDGSIVRDTQPRAADLLFGRGLDVQSDLTTGARGMLTVRGTRLEGNHDMGTMVLGSDAIFEGVAIRNTLPGVAQSFGRGMNVQDGSDAPMSDPRSTASIKWCTIEDSFDFGIVIFGSDVTVEGTAVRRVRPDMNGLFGDGIALASEPLSATAVLNGSLVAESSRAGLSSFGSHATVERTLFECNPVHLDGENHGSQAFAFEDLGNNECRCGDVVATCRVLTTNLTPPTPP
jgi:hypothetical protein